MLITRGWSPPSQKKVTQTCMKSITYNVSLLLLSSLFCVNIKYNYHILSFSFSLAENCQATKNNLKKSKIILTAARHIKSLILTIGINIWVSFFFIWFPRLCSNQWWKHVIAIIVIVSFWPDQTDNCLIFWDQLWYFETLSCVEFQILIHWR